MSYVKTTWVTGDIVTAPKLNNLESGVEANDLNKLNKPSGNGTAGQLLISNGDGSTSWTDTDTTLEESGKAADAKAVGDALGEINEALETKAEIDGYYEEMTVGDAEQLVSTVYVEESTPYLYRTTGGSADVGNREYLDKLVGVSVAWNQKIGAITSIGSVAGLTMNISDGEVTITGTATESIKVTVGYTPSPAYTVPANHVVLIMAVGKGNVKVGRAGFNAGQYNYAFSKHNVDFYLGVNFYFTNGEQYDCKKKVCGYDLTTAFGTTIADYVYSLETATAGSGIAWLKQYIDLDTYHPYDAGTLKHVEDLVSHDTVGFNQLDESRFELISGISKVGNQYVGTLASFSTGTIKGWEGFDYFPKTSYCFFINGEKESNATLICAFVYTDGSIEYIATGLDGVTSVSAYKASNASKTLSRISISYGTGGSTVFKVNKCCINLSWSGYRNGEYEPYEKHSYALDSSVVLRGVPTLVDGKLVYDGDEYLYDGTINRRYGIIDLGTINYSYQANTTYPFFYTTINGMKKAADWGVSGNLICTKYVNTNANNQYNNGVDKTICAAPNASIIRIRDTAYTDTISFKAAMSGVYLVYELEAPTTETAQPYTQVQICDDFGTEQFVTTSIIPVGTETRYPANLRDKLQHLPSLAEADGTYLIQQTDKDMSLIPFSGYVTEESLSETLEDYAVVDGYYEGMTVGNAEELVTGLTEEENVPFIFRTAGGSLEIGAREEMTVTGGSLAWNQLAEKFTGRTNAGVTSTVNDDGSITINGTATGNGALQLSTGTFSTPINHVFCMWGYKRQSTDDYMGFGGLTIDIGNGRIWKNTTTYDALTLRVDFSSGTVYDNVRIYPQYFDLTQMFGTTIADYIYNLEQSTAGAGVAWFKKLFPKDYYPYQVADLVHVNASEFKTIGFNQWDEEWEVGGFNYTTGEPSTADDRIRGKNFCPCLPSTEYYWKIPSQNIRILFYDANQNYINFDGWYDASRTITTPVNAAYFKIAGSAAYGTTYNHDICISIHWDNTRNGEYEPYTEHSYPLDSSLVLRGVPKIDTDGNLYYDGDTYEADGTVTRKYGIVDLGTLTGWSGNMSGQNAIEITHAISGKLDGRMNMVCDKLVTSAVTSATDTAEYTVRGFPTSNYVAVKLPKSVVADAAAAEAWIASNHPMLVYELATPTTETATPYQTPQIVDNWGTEEFVVTAQNGVEVPVGHSTIYPISLRDKLEAAPDLPDDSGDYVLRMSGNEASYARLASEFPAVPTSTDGVFVLKATVTNGTATLTWEAQS